MNKQELISLITETGIASVDEIKGCDEKEIEVYEKEIGFGFPSQYRNFLVAIGRGAGKLFQGTDIYFQRLSGMRQEAEKLLFENKEQFTIPDDAFVFLMHQGYEFNYFKHTEGDFSPIYQYVEGNGLPKVVWKDFDDFLKDQINIHHQAILKGYF